MSTLPRQPADLSPHEKRALLAQLLRKKAAGVRSFPLSFAQQRLWFLDQMTPGVSVYNVPLAVRLSGPLDVSAFDQSLRALVGRHDVLRTTFAPGEDGSPIQVVAPTLSVTLPVIDVPMLPGQDLESKVYRLAVEEAQRPFDLAKGPLLRATLLYLEEQEHVLLLTLHHIISDGWSLGVLLRDVMTAYQALVAGRQPTWPELSIQYADYAVWQRQWLQGEVLDRQLHYWKQRLAGAAATLDLPTDHPRPAVQSFRGALLPFSLSPEVVEGLRSLAKQEDCTLFMVLLAAFQTVLHRYSGASDLCVGTPIAGRNRPETEGLIGFFVNTLVLRGDLSGDPAFVELLRRVRETCLGAYAHQDVPFERLVEELKLERDLSRSPLFQVLFVLQNSPLPAFEFGGLRVRQWDVDTGTSKFDLSLFLLEQDCGLRGTLEYSTDLFEEGTAARLVGHFRTLLQAASADPQQRLSQLPLLSDDERRQLQQWNQTDVVYPQEHILHRLIEQQARLSPDAVAVSCLGRSLTFRQLDHRANALAHRLRSLGVGPDVIVGVCMERSVELVVSLLGVLKAGGAYAPLEPDYPRDRLAFMLQDAHPPVVLVQSRLLERLPEHDAQVIRLDDDWGADEPEHQGPPDAAMTPEHLAYVIYTSGSTGRPKGVLNRHRGVCNRLLWMQQQYRLTPADVVLQKTPFSFDVSVWEFFWPLLCGVRLVLARPGGHKDPSYLADLIQAEQVSVCHFVPSMLQAFLHEPGLEQRCRSLRDVMCSGEALAYELQERFFTRLDANLHNLYGPTEAAVDVTCWACRRNDERKVVPIGRPVANTQMHVLDSKLQALPAGVPGELYIGGVQVARGYLNREELTAEKFLEGPAGMGRLYRTGDLGRWLSDGAIEYLGRLDHQVKLRGFRIELGEIESVLLECAGVREAVVTAREDDSGDKRLVAYVVPRFQTQQEDSGNGEDRPAEQVSQWQTVWEETYGQESSPQEVDFNTVGWNSSYTGLPIPEAEMREWVENTVDRIVRRQPSRVLEIGCGAGLLLFRIAPRCVHYTGLDFSQGALRFLHAQVTRQERLRNKVSLLHRAAHELEGLAGGPFDTVIVNSVIQYFPGIDYLARVLEGAARIVAPGGRIFLGDVRNFRLLSAFHAAVQLHKAPASLSRAQLRARVQSHVNQERELLVDPAFFPALQRRIPGIGSVEIQLKRGRHCNEMTQFRYDVVLPIGAEPHTSVEPVVQDWQEQALTLPAVRRCLMESFPARVCFLRVPNARLQTEVKALELLNADEGPATANELREALRDSASAGVDPEDVWALGKELGYDVVIHWSDTGGDGCFDVEYRRSSPTSKHDHRNGVVFSSANGDPTESWSAYANDPLRGKVVRDVAPRLRDHLRTRLPEYMTPSAFVILDALPLSPNGKIDRKRLPAPDAARPELEEAYAAPATPVEQALAALWAEVLGVERVGTNDNFFELGGHSLLATQVISRIRKTLQIELPLRALFEAPTVGELAARIEEVRRAALGLPAAPLRQIAREGELPLSFGQETFWFLDQLEPGSPVFNIDVAVRLTGPLNVPVVEQALNEVVRRHDALRTTFTAREGRPSARIGPVQPASLSIYDLTALRATEREAEARRLADAESRRPFDLERGPLFRASLVRLGREDYAGLLTVHHSVYDGWSMGVFLREVGLLYQAFSTGRPSPFSPLAIQYVDFAHWQRQWLASGLMEDQLAYWKKQLGGALPALELPTDHPRPAARTFHGTRRMMVVPPTLTAAVQALARREGCTLFMVLLAAFQALLQRYSSQEDISVGTPIAGRNRAETEGLIGFFVNTLVLRGDLSANPSFGELLGRVRETCLGAYAHQDLPFEMLVQALRPQRELSRSSLFQVMFILQNAPLKIPAIAGLKTSPLMELADNGTSKFDLTLTMMEGTQGLTGTVEYNTDLFEDATIQRFLGHYLTLLEAVVAEPGLRLSRLPLLTAAEHQQLHDWNRTQAPYPARECIHDLFEAQASQTPDAIAVVCGVRSAAYGELNRRANRLAHQLRERGVRPEMLVGLYIDRSIDLLVGVLGVLKAGGAYVPLDPAYPGERVAAVIEDAELKVLLTQTKFVADLPDKSVPLLCVDAEEAAIGSEENPVRLASGENLAYVIYTSGTTGKPKGVMLTHAGLCNAYRGWEDAYHLRTDARRHLQMASCAFDVFTGDWVRALCSGGQLILCPRDALLDPAQLFELLLHHKVDAAEFVPAVLRSLVQHLEETGRSLDFMRLLVAGSDVWYAGEYRRIRQQCGPRTRLINSYGLTEATIDSTYFESAALDLPEDRPVPIGRPFANTQLYILDRNLQRTPVGVPGELHIGGRGVARGYFKQPERTAEKFIPNPFDKQGGKLFRTGDLARYLPDGCVELLGRTDYQVKIRGFRIEPGEIESLLGQAPGVHQAVVVARGESPDRKRLVAYVAGDPPPSAEELRAFLKEKLPEYMTPSLFVRLDKLPLTPNGKIDRQALPAPEQTSPEGLACFVAPRNPLEEIIADVWCKVLGLERVGATDNFFELGGHSLLATQVISRLGQAFGVELPLRRLFETPTVAGLAEAVDIARRSDDALRPPPLRRSANEGRTPLSFAQQRLWFLDRFEPDSAFYNIPAAARFTGRLDVAGLERALQEIVRRHESLRTTFQSIEGEPSQVVAPALALPLRVVDLSDWSSAERETEARRLARDETQRPFDLTHGPLLRATLIRLAPTEYVVLLVLHHIVSDGWSMRVFFREVAALYQDFAAGRGSRLPELPVQYADFACWQRDWLRGEVLEKQLAYWKERLTGAPAALQLPTDRPRPAVQTVHGATESLLIPKELVNRLHVLCRREGVTLYMTLLAVFQTLLYRSSGQDDLCVGTPIAGRGRPETEGLIGFFVNTLVLRGDLSGNPTFHELLLRVRETCLGAYAHQDLPFEMLVEALQPQRDLSRTSLFQVMFILQNAPLPLLEMPGLTLSPLEAESGTAKFDLTLAFTETPQGLVGGLEYNTDLFEQKTVRRFLAHYRNLLEGAAADPGQRISDLPLLTEDERRELLVEWNRTDASITHGFMHEMFEAQVARTPDAGAIVFKGASLSYRELNRKSNQLAHYLRSLGVGPDVLVGLCMERSLEMLVALLGVLKAGGAYVPLDPAYPKERLAFMLEDSQAPLVLTQQSLTPLLSGQPARPVVLELDADRIGGQSGDNPACTVRTDNLAYVIYTSGSTGRPKGVQIVHGAAANFLTSMQHWPGLTPRDVMLGVTTLSFDIAVLELFLPLSVGARIELATRETAQDATLLAEKLRSSGATVMQATPVTWRMLLETSWQGSPDLTIFCGGEALSRELAQQLLRRSKSVWNLYGPTETTVWSTGCQVIDTDGPVPIGRPIANTQVYVVDPNLQPTPIGAPGELLIGGAGLARGYLGRPELTAEKFIPNPFSDQPGARLYRTGDLARWLPGGELECLGRLDHQVKIRGFRIELGEIESVLSQHPAVRQAVVVSRDDTTGNKRLAAYIVPAEVSGDDGAEQVAHWQGVWDETYSSIDAAPTVELNFKGWNSSFTGQPIPEEEMREWLGRTVERIRALRPARILEIGCGAGLLLFQLAPHCSHYTGTDVSRSAATYLQERLAQRQPSLPVTIHHRPAEDFTGFAEKEFDIVVLNSVVQYFPDVHYLLKVLAQAVRVVRPGGFVFVGDVRNLRLLEAFHASVQLVQASDAQPVEALLQRIRNKAAQEKELLIDPAFFPALKAELPDVRHVELQLKRGSHFNEMTAFRYDVVLHIGGEAPPVVWPAWRDWQEEKLTLDQVRSLLEADQPPVLALTGIPNCRIPAAAVALTHRGEHPTGTVVDLRKAAVEAGVDPEQFSALGEHLHYGVQMRPTTAANDGRFDVVFHRPETAASIFDENPERLAWEAYVNNPLRGKAAQAIAPQLRAYLKDRLPEYMTPSAFVMLDALPQTPNGKVDRKALPDPEPSRPDGQAPFLAPRTPTEAVLAGVWAEVLGVERVGVHDNFFDLGGHSLQAVQLVARASRALGCDIPVKGLFLHPTIAALAESVEATRQSPTASEKPTRNGHVAPTAKLNTSQLAVIAPRLKIERRPLLPLFESGELARIDSAAIGVLPTALLEYMGLSPRDVIEGWCKGRPIVSGLYQTPLGRIGLLLVPRFDTQLYQDPDDLVRLLSQAVQTAGRLGARMVSLTGLLPSATQYGTALQQSLRGLEAPQITTGHATTTAAVVLTIQRILAEAGRDWRQERVGFLGLGSIGTATLRTVFQCLPHPAEVFLCDVYSKRNALLDLRRTLIEEAGYRGQVHVLEAHGGVPAELYQTSLIIGAANVPDILDVDRLAPGTLVVDDSSPHCFRLDRAVQRLRERQDVLFTAGGALRAPHPLDQVIYIPGELDDLREFAPAELFANYDSHHITGCVLSSLLSAGQQDLPPTVGLVGPQACLEHYRALERLGFQAAALHCEAFAPDEDVVQAFRTRFAHHAVRP